MKLHLEHFQSLWNMLNRYTTDAQNFELKIAIIFLSMIKICVIGAQKNCLIETVLWAPPTYVLIVKKENKFSIIHFGGFFIYIFFYFIRMSRLWQLDSAIDLAWSS